MKLIIYAGMPKTGSTSIQRTLKGLEQEFYTYAPTGQENMTNHNGVFHLCFSDENNIVDVFPDSRADQTRLREMRKETLRQLRGVFESNTKPAVLFAAESISQGRTDTTRRFAEYCQSITDDIEVYAYIRPPLSFMQSMFQRDVKYSTYLQERPLLVWPNYRQPFELLDECFGRERVRLRLYDPSRFPQRDVVLDFAGWVGVPLAKHQVFHRNEAMSLEQTALNYTFKTLLPPRRLTPWRSVRQWHFAQALAAAGSSKLRFTPESFKPVLERNRADLQWMEERLGERLEDTPTPAPGQIGSTEELLTVAEGLVEKVERIAGKTAPAGASVRQRLLFALCAVYDRPPDTEAQEPAE